MLKKIKKITRDHILWGGLALAGVALFIHTQKCGVLRQFFSSQCSSSIGNNNVPYDMGPSIADPDPFSILRAEEELYATTRPVTDDWVQDYNRFINGYREKPTMFPENYYKLPFRHNTPKGILTSPGMPHPFFGANPMNPEPNWHNNWIRQPFSF